MPIAFEIKTHKDFILRGRQKWGCGQDLESTSRRERNSGAARRGKYLGGVGQKTEPLGMNSEGSFDSG